MEMHGDKNWNMCMLNNGGHKGKVPRHWINIGEKRRVWESSVLVVWTSLHQTSGYGAKCVWGYGTLTCIELIPMGAHRPTHPLLNSMLFPTFLTKLVMCLPQPSFLPLPSFIYLQVCENEFLYVCIYPTI